MKKKGYFLLGILFLFCLSFVYATIEEDQTIFKLYQSANSHAEVWNGTGNYPIIINFADLFPGAVIPENPHECKLNDENLVIRLFSNTNSHVSFSDSSYTKKVCYGNLVCNIRAGCLGDEVPVASLFSTTNSHIGLPDVYTHKLCCIDTTESPCTPNCVNASDVACGEYIDDPACPGQCSGQGTMCASEETCNQETWTCESNIIPSNPRIYWANESGEISGEDAIVKIIPDTTKIQLWLVDSGIASGNVIFTVYNDSATNEIINEFSSTTNPVGEANVNWTVSLGNLTKLIGGPGVKFNISSIPGLEINNIKLETTRTGTCGDYQNATECNAFTRTIARASISPCDSVIINDFCTTNYQCSCAWNAEAGTCGGRSVSQDVCVSGENFIFNGSCEIRDSAGDNCDDGFLDSSLTADWTWGNDVSKNLTNPNRQDFIFDNLTGYYYYDPNADSLDCLEKAGENTIPCPGQIRLPFFGFYQLLISLLGIGLIYLIFNRRKFYK